MCKSLRRGGSDCKWRGAFSVTGSFKLSVTDIETFVASPEAKAGVAHGIANVTGIPAEYVDVDLVAETQQRRLRAQELPKASALMVAHYAITVDGAAPASISSTGQEATSRLMAANDVDIAQAISTSVDEFMGPSSTLQILSVEEATKPSLIGATTSGSSTASVTHSEAITTLIHASSVPTTQAIGSAGSLRSSTTTMMPARSPTTVQAFEESEFSYQSKTAGYHCRVAYAAVIFTVFLRLLV